ncbi:MAG TPA: hypothetical protein VHD63_28840, partial [Ktedonobacteraceae bacterium]|nr:hypothetical protein [Ktedonobacteraceae bacterium]
NLVQEGQQHFVATYTNRIASQMPSPEKIRSSFAFRFYRVRGTQPLSEPAEESFPEGRATAVGEMRAETDQRTRQRAILENDLRQDAHQRVNAMLDEWLTTIVGHLRALVCEAAEDVLATLKRRGGERFSGRSTMQLNNLITQIRSLNFFGDAEMDQMMARVEQIVSLSPAERQRSLGDIQRTLRAIATTTRATLLDLDEHPRAPRADLGVAAIPSPQLVHAARAELHLPPLDPAHMASLEPSTRVSRAELGSLNAPLWRFAEQEAPAARGARTL